MSRNRRRNSKGKTIFVTIIVLGLLVFLGADNFGFDWFNFKVDLNKSSNPPTQETNSNKDQVESKKQYINIVVKDDKITLNEESIDSTTLKSELEKLDTNTTTINLMDSGAYNETFTEIENLLTEKGFKFITSSIISN